MNKYSYAILEILCYWRIAQFIANTNRVQRKDFIKNAWGKFEVELRETVYLKKIFTIWILSLLIR